MPKAFFIITEKKDILQEAIIRDLSRGATILDAKGGYTNQDKNVMLVVVNHKNKKSR